MPVEPITRPRESRPIIASETVSFAPEEMPSTNGPAMGLAKKVWSRKPEIDSAPPSSMAAISRGRRISHTMAAFSPVRVSRMSMTSAGDRCRLPVLRFQRISAASSAASRAKPKV